MLLGFKRRFALYVQEGSKTHTIRAPRADGKLPRVGEVLHCYVDPRQKSMRLLGRFKCTRVEPVSITGGLGGIAQISIAGHWLSPSEMEAFARRDGFREGGLREMSGFWHDVHGLDPAYTFHGYLIHWEFKP